MHRRLFCLFVLCLMLAGAGICRAGLQKWKAAVQAAGPVHWYQFDEAPGTTVASDKGSGARDGAYRSLVDLGQDGLLGPGQAARFERGGTEDCMWTQGGNVTSPEWTAEFIVMKLSDAEGEALSDSAGFSLRIVGWGVNFELSFTQYGVIDARFTAVGGASLVAPLQQWVHVAYRKSGAQVQVFLDGVLVGTTSTLIDCPIDSFGGRAASASDGLDGFLDEAVIYDRALTDAEIAAHAAAPFTPDVGAIALQPENGATDVPQDTVLEWLSGMYAQTHDVYLGTVSDEVAAAERSNPLGVLASEGQTDTTYDPAGALEFGRTYYWRVDEVNGTPDNAIFQGDVWSFTVEPLGYPITNVTATASSAQTGLGPENTINGSGLNANDEHSTELTHMWMTTGAQPNWIQYEFDNVYKLHEMWVWNSNQLIESLLGFGAKNVTVEYSADGETWTVLEGAPEFARATGMATYAANTTVDFGGAVAKFVRLTINQTWGGLAPQTGLSEVRFFYIPTQAREPVPADGATDIGVDAELNWRPGREATSHQLYFGADVNALTPADTVTDHRFTPGALSLGTTYYWRVDEVGDSGTYEGEVWSFTTRPFAVVEDFESYNDDDSRIYDAWIDGLTDPAKGGSQVGYDVSPFAEKTIIHSGAQSMPLIYNNTGAAFSEAEFTVDQDWTANGIQSLSLWFRGAAGNSGTLYVKINNTKVSYEGPASHISAGTWLPWNIDLSTVGGNLSNVRTLTIGVEGSGASGTLYLDDIRLYPRAPEFIVPALPDDANLVGHWTLDEGSGTVAKDSSGNGNNGALDGAQWVAGVQGGALQFDGSSSVDCGNAPQLALTQALSLTLWVNPANLTGDRAFAGRSAADGGYAFKSLDTHLRFTTPGIMDHDGDNSLLQFDTWQHVAVTFVPGQDAGCVFYINGIATDTLNSSALAAGAGPFEIGHNHWNQWCLGMIDEVRVYDRVLSAEEVAALAGHTNPLPKPF